MNKKLLSCLVITTLLIGMLFSACGKGEDNKQDDVDSSNTTVAQSTQAVTTGAPELKADISMWVYPGMDKEDAFFNDKVNEEFIKTYYADITR